MDLSSGFPHGQAPVPTSNSARCHALGTLSECLFFFGIYSFHFGGIRRALAALQFLEAPGAILSQLPTKNRWPGCLSPKPLCLRPKQNNATLCHYSVCNFTHHTARRPQFKPPHGITRSHHSWPGSLSYMCLRTSWQRGRHSATQTCKPTD